MNTQASLPAESICTCGYLTGSPKDLYPYRNTELTHQIGSLLIALGSIFEADPLLRIHLNPGTSQLLNLHRAETPPRLRKIHTDVQLMASKSPVLFWEYGTAYELFVSLYVLHKAEDFGIRPSFAAGVRSRIPSAGTEIDGGYCPFLRPASQMAPRSAAAVRSSRRQPS